MTTPTQGPVAAEIEARLTAALSPARLAVINDSAKHRGHMGDDGSGESHFTVEIESAAFAGQTRLARQRMVNHALGDLLRERVHALAIRATAPGE
ncbi:BolA family protein [Sphingomonas cavernae]|uniref:BolA family transcriptional regulator n=1 Tax=Sphingomonas cavernae TaxID=2320861 RepID=A0A418WQ61_9SPHN|nr:BolA family protein [Sphingomonas cavernae]RJF93384.1 BolA family transcriptional regulator [Sphingomonas cavernae]